MDGGEGTLRESLRFRLSLWLSVAILGVAVVSGIVSVAVAYDEAHEFQDDMLRQTALLFDQDHLPSAAPPKAPGPSEPDPEARVLVRLVSPGGGADSAASQAGVLGHLGAGAHTVALDGVPYRAFVQVLASGDRIVAAQQTEVRNEAAGDAALRALIPILALVPILLGVVGVLVRRLFAPIERTAAELARRGGEDLQSIALQGMPTEIRPFVGAINSLLGRVRESMAMQRRFVATAAHELRSPLAALSLQAERLGASDMPDEARGRVATLRQGVDRNRRLVDQLLTLARAQASGPVGPATASVRDELRGVLEELMPLAEAKQLDIGAEGGADLHVAMNETDLRAVLRNVVGNAIHYTPQGGRIDLACMPAAADVEVAVEDTGPGIPASQRERVFEAFHREAGHDAPGAGLGLSIVRTLVQRVGGRVELGDARRSRSGLRVVVRIPSVPEAGADRSGDGV